MVVVIGLVKRQWNANVDTMMSAPALLGYEDHTGVGRTAGDESCIPLSRGSV